MQVQGSVWKSRREALLSWKDPASLCAASFLAGLIHPPSATRTERSTAAPHNTGKQTRLKVKGQPASVPDLRQALNLVLKTTGIVQLQCRWSLHAALKPHLGRLQKGLGFQPGFSRQSVRAV